MAERWLNGDKAATLRFLTDRTRFHDTLISTVWLIESDTLPDASGKHDTFTATGMCIDPKGILLTCAHVLQGGTLESCKLGSDGILVPATVLKRCDTWDMVLLQVQSKNPTNFDYVRFPDDKEVEEEDVIFCGEEVHCIGNSDKLYGSFITGRVAYPFEGYDKKLLDLILKRNENKYKHRATLDGRMLSHRSIGSFANETHVAYNDLNANIPLFQISNFYGVDGTSGSPVFDNRGYVIGMAMCLHGYDNLAIHVCAIKRFIKCCYHTYNAKVKVLKTRDEEDPTQKKRKKKDRFHQSKKRRGEGSNRSRKKRNQRDMPSRESRDNMTVECSLFKSAPSKRKAMLENQLIEISEQPSVGILELKVLFGLLKLGKGPLAHQIFLKSYGSRLQRSIKDLLAICPCYPETYSATLSDLVFSMISLTTKESGLMFDYKSVYGNKIVQWAEWEIESLVRLVKENVPPYETSTALRAASVCVQASLNDCAALETQDLKLTKLLLVLLQSYVEEVLELNFRQARKVVLDLVGGDEPRFASLLSTLASSSDHILVDCGMRFIFVVKEIVEQLTRLVILYFGGNMWPRISQLLDKYVEILINSSTGPTEDDNLTELKESVPFKAERDSQELALSGTAFTVAEELLPMVVSRTWNVLNESKSKEAGSGLADNLFTASNSTIDPRDWRRQLQHSLNKLRDHFCRQYVLSFIYSTDGETRLDAQTYLGGKGQDSIWQSDPLHLLLFQALFGKLQQLAAVTGDVLLGREEIQKVLLARLTETVVMWLSDEQEIWGVLEHNSATLLPVVLQHVINNMKLFQVFFFPKFVIVVIVILMPLVLDMHFAIEIAQLAGYPSRHLHKISSDIIARAVKEFSARGIDPQRSERTKIESVLSGAAGVLKWVLQ